MIRLGLLDFDTSHVVAFSQRLNQLGVAKDQWVEGARVVMGCPGESRLAPGRIAGYTEDIRKMGIPLVDKPSEMIGKIDGLLLCSLEGGVHLERARPFLEKGIPIFIDKPFACSRVQATTLVELAKKHKAPIFGSSSLRYADEVVKVLTEIPAADRVGAAAWGPASLSEIPDRNPGLYHYGIHAAEILYTLMGPGCKSVSRTKAPTQDQVTGVWQDGRVGTYRGILKGKAEFGATVYGTKSVQHGGRTISYEALCRQVGRFFRTGVAPVSAGETIEIFAFMEAADESQRQGGKPVELAGVLEKAKAEAEALLLEIAKTN